ncbi:MAG: phosphoglycerate kinase [Rickettsiales bacterium]|jgi:phosphoglycerate kinase|nr:phosphoglycerate kinase [Rickettsiales bacterium]
MFRLKTLADIPAVVGKRVIVRADLNVPSDGGRVMDATRIVRFAPTAKWLADRGAKVVVITHFGRPKGKSPEFSTGILVFDLAKALGIPVGFASDTIGPEVESKIAAMRNGDVLLLENVRFYPEEEANDAGFSRELAALGDIYVNDAFSAAHRAHASTEGIAKYLPSYAGLLMTEEVDALAKALENPARPALAIVAGSKVSTKLEVLANISAKVDAMAIGGAMANTFLLAKGYGIGASMAEPDMAGIAEKILARARESGCEIILPVDVCVAKELKENAEHKFVGADHVEGGWKIFDIGPETIRLFEDRLAKVKTVLLNGTVGVYETAPFNRGSIEIARAVARLTKAGKLVSVAGGGDTVASINQAGAADGFTYISTAGGAFLEWLEGKTLPAIVPLTEE